MSRTLLVVEDEPATSRAVVRHFSRLGYEVTVAATATSARACSGPFDVAIFDILLPDGDGVDLAKDLMKRGMVFAAVFFTSTTDDRMMVAPGRFVQKTQGLAELEAAVARACESNA